MLQVCFSQSSSEPSRSSSSNARSQRLRRRGVQLQHSRAYSLGTLGTLGCNLTPYVRDLTRKDALRPPSAGVAGSAALAGKLPEAAVQAGTCGRAGGRVRRAVVTTRHHACFCDTACRGCHPRRPTARLAPPAHRARASVWEVGLARRLGGPAAARGNGRWLACVCARAGRAAHLRRKDFSARNAFLFFERLVMTPRSLARSSTRFSFNT